MNVLVEPDQSSFSGLYDSPSLKGLRPQRLRPSVEQEKAIRRNPLTIFSEEVFGLSMDTILPRNQSYGVPVVIVPGMWCPKRLFHGWMYDLARAGFKVHTLSLKNCATMEEFAQMGFYDYVRNLETLLRHIGPSRVIGFSLGALAAMKTAEDPNLKIEAAVFAMSTPPSGIKLPLGVRIKMMNPHYLSALFQLKPFMLTPEDRDNLLLSEVSPSRRHFYNSWWKCESARVLWRTVVRGVSINPDLITNNCKRLLVVGGSRDKLVPIKVMLRVKDFLKSDRHWFRCGHVPMIEDSPGAKKVLPTIVRWLNQVGPCPDDSII